MNPMATRIEQRTDGALTVIIDGTPIRVGTVKVKNGVAEITTRQPVGALYVEDEALAKLIDSGKAVAIGAAPEPKDEPEPTTTPAPTTTPQPSTPTPADATDSATPGPIGAGPAGADTSGTTPTPPADEGAPPDKLDPKATVVANSARELIALLQHLAETGRTDDVLAIVKAEAEGQNRRDVRKWATANVADSDPTGDQS